MTLTITSREAPVEATLPVAELAAQLRLPDGWETVPGQFARLAGRLRAAVETIELRCGRVLLDRTVTLWGHAPGGRVLVLPVAPVTTVVAITSGGTEMDLEDMEIEHDGDCTILRLSQALVAGADVMVAARAGATDWSLVAPSLAEAVLLAAEALDGGGSDDHGRLIARMIAPHRVLRIGRA